MPVIASKKLLDLAQAANPKVGILSAMGDLSKVTIMRDLVLIAIYIRPEMTEGGILRPLDNIKEDEFQGKVGLIVKTGPEASEYEDETEPSCKVGDWVVFTIRDGVQMTVNGVACRLMSYNSIRMKLSSPEVVF